MELFGMVVSFFRLTCKQLYLMCVSWYKVLKSTCAAGKEFNAAPFVIDELKVVGSRCGPIDRALELLALKEENPAVASDRILHVEKYITKTFPLAKADEAIRCAAEKSTMKVQIICSEQ